ncbi:serine-rich adhesin for platelets-like [Patiria miniata]|uniref:Uncharacterized protein n=1 Tax=Patiria miniata TaxID=46514 RepID=A0A914A452_PATMI|nr:serine-rich adhesin for platelets-like [Patiria miniata]
MAIWCLLIPLLAMIGVGLGNSTGAPETACVDMTPRHKDVVAMDTESPYRLEIDDSTVSPGGVITVTITGGRAQFRGFLLQARWVNDDQNPAAVGLFTPSDRRMQTLACNGQENSALTHTNRGQKTTLEAVWRAPRNVQGPMRFIATVVKSLEEYWTEITSDIVTIAPTRPDFTTEVYQSTVRSTTSSRETTAESTTDYSPTTTGELYQETESTSTQVDGSQTSSLGVSTVTNSSVLNTTPLGEETASPNMITTLVNVRPTHNTGTSTPFERLETTSTQPVQVTHSTTPLTATLATMLGTVDTPLTTVVESTSTVDSEVSSTVTQAVDVTGESTMHNGTAASNETRVVTELSTTSQSDFHTTQPLMENTTTIPAFSDFETSTLTLETPTPSQYENTTVLTVNTSSMETPTLEPSNESSTLEIPKSPDLSTEMTSSVTPTDNSSLVDSTSTSVGPSTTLLDATSSQLLPHTSTTASTSTEPLDDSPTTSYDASTSQPNTSTTLSDAATELQPDTSTTPLQSTESLVDMSTTSSTSESDTSTTLSTAVPTPSSNTSSASTPSTQSTTAPVEMFTTLPVRNDSSTAHVNISHSPDSDFVTNATESTVMTSLAETLSVENSTVQITTQNTTEEITVPPLVPQTTMENIGETELISTSAAPSSRSTSVSAMITSGSTSRPLSTKTTSGSTTESTSTGASLTTSASTTEFRATTSGSTTEFTTESISTTQTTLLQSTEASTTPMAATSTAQQQLNPEVSTAYVISEEANEIRMRVRIEGIPFTEDLNDPASESFRSIARQVEQEISDLYTREGVTMVDSVKVLKITRGSIVPEVQILASTDLDESTKSAWLSVMYNEVQNSGSLGNFTVSDMSAVTTDGTFVEVDPCFLLPCPVSMVCYVYQTNCFSNCYLNDNYCLNDGVCEEPSGEKQLASCRCDTRHEGDRCEVRKDPVSPPPTGEDNSNLIIAAVWGSIGSVCFVLIIIFSTWLVRYRRRKQRWRHTAKLMGNIETGSQNRAQMDSYARRLTSIRAGVLIDLANISISGSEAESTEGGRQRSRTTSLSDAESTDHQPRFIDGGVHIGGMPDILQGASTTDYEMDFMNRPLSQKRKSVSFNDVTEMIDFVATENFTLGNPEGGDGNFQVRWDFQVDRSDSRESNS